jgi:hypothetical protein
LIKEAIDRNASIAFGGAAIAIFRETIRRGRIDRVDTRPPYSVVYLVKIVWTLAINL